MDPGVDVSHASDIADVAARSSVAFLRGHKDLYRRYLDRGDLGMVGHSQGSMGVSRAQSDLPQVKAIVGMDNLRAFGHDDPGGIGCKVAGTLAVTPKVPGLGIGSETGCGRRTDKLAGYHAWRAATPAGSRPTPLATMEVVLAHSDHPSFGGGGAQSGKHLRQLRATGYYMRAWLDRWLKDDQGAQTRPPEYHAPRRGSPELPVVTAPFTRTTGRRGLQAAMRRDVQREDVIAPCLAVLA